MNKYCGEYIPMQLLSETIETVWCQITQMGVNQNIKVIYSKDRLSTCVMFVGGVFVLMSVRVPDPFRMFVLVWRQVVNTTIFGSFNSWRQFFIIFFLKYHYNSKFNLLGTLTIERNFENKIKAMKSAKSMGREIRNLSTWHRFLNKTWKILSFSISVGLLDCTNYACII